MTTPMAASTSGFTCNTCSAVFESSGVQRAHMREPWHLYNLQRRMVSLPPVTLQRYEAQVLDEDTPVAVLTCPTCEKKCTSEKAYQRHIGKHGNPLPHRRRHHHLKMTRRRRRTWTEPELLPTECLFCNLPSPALDDNLAHMYARHGLFLPEPDRIIDTPTLLAYLTTLVCSYAECLFCGLQKGSRASIQAHMRDKGHCKIDAGPASELWDFWAHDDDEDAKPKSYGVKISETELQLPSGAILGTRHAERHVPGGVRAESKRTSTHGKSIEGTSADPKPAARPSSDRRVAVRGEQGLTGVSEQQRRALMVVEKNMMKREAVARSAQRWASEKVANKQKFYRADGPGRSNG
ncbi:C2H2 type zinc-finger-domain-containing protein [Mycena vulgaris]|nr:C2H2 type zinc-finger-domain-containing protein [Mycena vulgaris]